MTDQIGRRGFLAAAAIGSFSQLAPSAGSALAAAPVGNHKEPYRGVFIIMQTPFLESLEIDEESLRREADFLVRCGVHGMVWPAGAGETKALSHDERIKYGKSIVEEARGRTPVVIGVHAPNKFEAVQYAREVEKMGADAMIALSQTDGSNDPKVLEDYFTAIANASTLPLIIQVTSPALTVDFLIKLAHKLPTFRYVKEEQRPVPPRIDRYVAEAKDVLTPMTGGGSRNLLNEMARGSAGTMPGAGFADIQAQIWDWYDGGEKKKARDLFAKMLMMAVLEQHTSYVVQKEILRRRGVFKTVTMRSTSKFNMDKGDLHELDEIFEVLRPYFRV
jgi:dihydrodipicolinate synthase/N-acetylneuraminate lyase